MGDRIMSEEKTYIMPTLLKYDWKNPLSKNLHG